MKRQVVQILIGAAALVAVLSATVFLVNGPLGISDCSGAIGCGWLVPVLAAGVIAGILLFLSGQAPKLSDDLDSREVHCPGCGAPVLATWRLCPSCGGRLVS